MSLDWKPLSEALAEVKITPPPESPLPEPDQEPEWFLQVRCLEGRAVRFQLVATVEYGSVRFREWDRTLCDDFDMKEVRAQVERAANRPSLVSKVRAYALLARGSGKMPKSVELDGGALEGALAGLVVEAAGSVQAPTTATSAGGCPAGGAKVPALKSISGDEEDPEPEP